MDALAEKLAGRFVVFDGPDGCGKTTQLDRLRENLEAQRQDVVRTRDPGGTEIGEAIRGILLGDHLHGMDVRCEALLFMASRAQLVSEIVRPALTEGKTVLCDRFISSTCAYQAAAGYDPAAIIELGKLAVRALWPDVTVVLDIPADVGLERARARTAQAVEALEQEEGAASSSSESSDSMEERPLDFHRRVRDLFRRLPEIYPKPVVVVDAAGTQDEVQARVMKALCDADF